MPTYDLTCTECGHRFERFLLRLLRETDKVCPQCGSERVTAGVGGGFVSRNSTECSSCAPQGGFG